MAGVLQRWASLLILLALALAVAWTPSVTAAGAAPAVFVDAVLADVDGTPVAASDIALARGLGLFGLRPSEAPIQAGDVERFVDALLVEREAARLGIQGSAEEVEAAWQAAAARLGGMGSLMTWLLRSGIEAAWARRLVAAELRRTRFMDLRFRAFAFLPEADVLGALGPGPHTEEARRRTREALTAEVTDRELSRWLTEARARARIQPVAAGWEAIPNPFPMPGDGRRSRDPEGRQ